MQDRAATDSFDEIGIIGLSGRFPGARDVDEFWQNLHDGVECITGLSDRELESAGVSPALLNRPDYVKAGALLADIEMFDASFFGFSPREARFMDPQQRLLLECAWQALESAGYDSLHYDGAIGVYVGAGLNTYFLNNLYPNRDLLESVGDFEWMQGNEKDFLAAWIAYKLNLKGPAISVQTACSTSLVAVHMACQSLLNGECDMALAGGVQVQVPQRSGYLYREGMILSPDGHCRAFDARAEGTVSGSGIGLVVLKRVAEAVTDGDTIHAIIKGSAINNDGGEKVGFTSPSVDGQAAVVAEALALAAVEPETVTYVEAHGTGTRQGDPIEVRALTQAFRTSTNKTGFCALGSVKTNVGHLGAAAGVAGLIKTVLALRHGLLPASLHFTDPNPGLALADSPFYVNTARSSWRTGGPPRRAGVSSFGIGGTNAHVVLEEAAPCPASGESRSAQLLVLSARTSTALDRATANLVAYLQEHPGASLADVCFTLQVGRRPLRHRRILVCRSQDDVLEALDPVNGEQPLARVMSSVQDSGHRSVVFLFPGEGTESVNMAAGLYHGESVFREAVDHCSDLLRHHLEEDLRHALYPGDAPTVAAEQRLSRPAVAQPALFVIEYALARQWLHWGVTPEAMIGHGIGEYVAACLAGVLSLENALTLVAARGRLNTDQALHSPVTDAMLESFTEQVRRVPRAPPTIPYLSNVTGTWMTAADALDAGYWARHLRHGVRFAADLDLLSREPDLVLLEVGPGQTMCALANNHSGDNHLAVSTLREAGDPEADVASLLHALGRLWLAGIDLDWSAFHAGKQRRRIPLPTYPFERRHFWVAPPEAPQVGASRRSRQDEPAHPGPVSSRSGPADPDPIEDNLAMIWRDLLGVESVSTGDNFFSLGGNSFVALQVIHRLREDYQVEVPVDALLEAPTVSGLARVVARLRPRPQDLELLDQLLGEIGDLSPPEARQRLADESPSGAQEDVDG